MLPYACGGRIEKRKLVLAEPRAFTAAMANLADQPVTVRIEKPVTKRSLNQNAYWWSVPVALIAEHCGYTPSQAHYALLGECFGYTEGPTGKPMPVKPSSSELTVDEFKTLIDWVLTWGPSELGVLIPEPHEVL